MIVEVMRDEECGALGELSSLEWGTSEKMNRIDLIFSKLVRH